MGAASSAAAVRSWTAEDVAARVTAFGTAYVQYAAAIKENGVDGEVLLSLDPATLQTRISDPIQLAKLSVELRRLTESVCTDLRQEQQARRRERQRQEQEVIGLFGCAGLGVCGLCPKTNWKFWEQLDTNHTSTCLVI